MRDYEIGYGKPPRHSQFKKGVCANPRGRPGRRHTEIGDVVRGFLSAKTEYREKGRIRKTSRLELAIKRHVASALNGDVGSAAMLLKMRAQAMKFGDTGPMIINVINPPGLVAEHRARENGLPYVPSIFDRPPTDPRIRIEREGWYPREAKRGEGGKQ